MRDLSKSLKSLKISRKGDAQSFEMTHQKVRKCSKSSNFECEMKRRGTGEPRWILLSSKPINYLGESAIFSAFYDITERKEMESELRESQQTLKIALEASNTGIWQLNFKTNEAFLTAQWFRQLGYEPDEFKSNNSAFEELLHPNDKERVLKSIEFYEKGLVDEYVQEFRLQSKEGNWKWILSKGKVYPIPFTYLLTISFQSHEIYHSG